MFWYVPNLTLQTGFAPFVEGETILLFEPLTTFPIQLSCPVSKTPVHPQFEFFVPLGVSIIGVPPLAAEEEQFGAGFAKHHTTVGL